MSVLDENFADKEQDKIELSYYRGAYNVLLGRLNRLGREFQTMSQLRVIKIFQEQRKLLSIADQLQCVYGEYAAKLITDHIEQFDYEISPYEDNLKELLAAAKGDVDGNYFSTTLDNLRNKVIDNEMRIIGGDNFQNVELMMEADAINQQFKKKLCNPFNKS